MEKSAPENEMKVERNEQRILTIAQDAIAFLHFPKQEVLRLRQELKNRAAVLNYLMSQLNAGVLHVSILFEDIAGTKKVNATVKAVREKEVILHPQMSIPIHRITQIEVIEKQTRNQAN